nr:DNA-directed DNA polymerase [Tanacetum cinerariifolium]
MADQRTMAQLLQAPTEGYEDAIVVLAITSDNFELKHGLLILVQNKYLFGHDKENPYAHIRYFNKINSTLKFPNVSNTSIKLILFPFSLEGIARIWLEKEPPQSIFTWDDLVLKFINQFFPPSKTTNLRNEITNFQQRFDESFIEAWDIFKYLLRAFPRHGFSELHQLDTFYNALNSKDQDSLNSAAGDMVKVLLLDKKSQNQAPATVKAVEESCKLPEKLGDPGKFLIPCDILRKAECLALADLGASINLMPLSVWNKLYLPDLAPTCMALELADHSISRLIGVAEDVYLKVGSFHFPDDFVVVDFNADPQVPLILRRTFLKTERALTLCVSKEAITFSLDQTLRYSANYNDITAKRIDFIHMACVEYSQEVLGSYNVITNDPTSPEVDQSYLDSDGDILLLEAFLNNDPSLPPPNQGNYLLEVCKELKLCDAKSDKSSIDEPPEVELKDLPPHLEYAFLEGNDKFPVIIAKYLSVEEKTTLITVLKSHKRAIAWKLFDIKGIDPEFCTHKILLEEDFEPAGGFTVVENEDNELIPARLVTGWRVCIDYRKLNEATRKDHFPLLFMDQMLERSAGNQYYCFLDGFSSYFQITIDLKDQEKTTFTCPYETFAYRCMPFGLCNAPGTFQSCLSYLERMLKRCEDTNLCLNWEKSQFMVKEGIILGHKISKQGIEVDKPKVDVITKLPHPTTVKGIRSFLGHAGFYRRMLTEAPILIAPDWEMPFELMCDVSDFAIGAVLGQRQDKHSRLIHYASKTMIEAESNYTTTEKEMLAMVYAFEKFRYYLIMNKSIEFTFKVIDTKGVENLAAEHLFRLENPHQNVLDPKEINESFHLETLNLVSTRGENHASWSDKLDDAVWAFRTASKTRIGCTPYKLVYEKACHLLIELEHKAYWALKHANFDLKTADDHIKVQLNELNEHRDQAYENSLIYKEKTKRIHDSKIKDRVFNIGDRVLLFNSRLKIFSNKLKSRWSGPFTISHVYLYGTVKLAQPDGTNFKVNGHRLKHYFEEDVPKLVVPSLQTFPKEH